MQTSALLRAYTWWCDARGFKNRRLSPVELLDHMAQHYGIEAGTVKVTTDGEESFVYALPNITFARDPSLNWRLRYRMPMTLSPDMQEAEKLTSEQRNAKQREWRHRNPHKIRKYNEKHKAKKE